MLFYKGAVEYLIDDHADTLFDNDSPSCVFQSIKLLVQNAQGHFELANSDIWAILNNRITVKPQGNMHA